MVYWFQSAGAQELPQSRPSSRRSRKLHVAIPVLHGTNGEDGIFEGLLETIGIPFAGCNTLSSANGMDKITMKMILRSEGIPVVD